MAVPRDALGGYPALERGTGSAAPWPVAATGYQSARAALCALLRAARPRALWIPHWICGAVADAARAAGTPVRRYPLDEGLGVPASLELPDGDWLLACDYFGLTRDAVVEACARFGPARVVVDASQALFHAAIDGASTIYSPRKFVGVPDGGWLATSIPPPAPPAADEGASLSRCAHLLRRLAGDAEGGYAAFRAAEASLDEAEPRAMSELTRRLLDGIDYPAVAHRRRSNFDRLRALLPAPVRERGDAVPSCYPLRIGDAEPVRMALVEQRVYCPRYWPDCTREDAVTAMLLDDVLYLPCDQRYDDADMRHLAELVARRGAS